MVAVPVLYLPNDRNDGGSIDAGCFHQSRRTRNVIGIDGFQELVDLVDGRQFLEDHRAFEVRVHCVGPTYQDSPAPAERTQGRRRLQTGVGQPYAATGVDLGRKRHAARTMAHAIAVATKPATPVNPLSSSSLPLTNAIATALVPPHVP